MPPGGMRRSSSTTSGSCSASSANAELAGDEERRVEAAMRPGPSTFRLYASVKELARFLIEHDLESTPITTSDGRLVGLVRREDAVRAAAASTERPGPGA
jgi:predicted transcriptional regulator